MDGTIISRCQFTRASRKRVAEKLHDYMWRLQDRYLSETERQHIALEVGKLIYDEATSALYQNEIPHVLKLSPWMYIIQKLEEEAPALRINAQGLLKSVERYLLSQREGS